MRDVALLLMALAAAGASLHRPWLGALALGAVAASWPFGYAQGFAQSLPVLPLLLGATALGALVAGLRGQLVLPWRSLLDWRLGLLALLWLQLALSTRSALVPQAASESFQAVSLMLLGLLALPLLVDERDKLRALLAATAIAIAAVAVKGGYWALMEGFGDRVYGPPGSPYYDNNHFAVLVVMSLPLLVLLRSWCATAGARRLVETVLALSLLAALSSWSRGALLALGVTLGLALLLQARRRLRSLAALVLLGVVVLAFMPEAWLERMQSIAHYEQDASAQGRLEMWALGLRQALEHPLGGIGFQGWRSVSDTGLDWHSAYVEVLAEHGFIGLALWLALLLGVMGSLLGLARSTDEDLGDIARALLASLAGYATGAAFLAIAFWQPVFQLLLCSLLLRGFARAGASGSGAASSPRTDSPLPLGELAAPRRP